MFEAFRVVFIFVWIMAYVCPFIAIFLYYVAYSNAIDIDEAVQRFLPCEKEEPNVISSTPTRNDWGDWIILIVFGMFFVGLWVFLVEGFEASLWFIPNSWGEYDEYDTYESASNEISWWLGFVSAAAIYAFMDVALKARIKLQK